MGFWMLKFSRSRVDDALDLNPAFKIGVGTELRSRFALEAGYFPLKGPTFVVNSAYAWVKYRQ